MVARAGEGTAMNQKILWFLFVVVTAYGAWSFFVASRYQSLCQLSYWSSTDAQLRACDELQTELRGK
ncbi:MAG: hypothetical protein C3F11_02330 [Methylocystaceae bacterium]|nr:MAG: hypothetical protein C3F11_02330 [Methylocystaceae bacterium]